MGKLLFAAILALGSCSTQGAHEVHLKESTAICGSDADCSTHFGDGSPQTCQEDDPCFNCLTMGNRACGKYPELRIETDPDGHISVFWGTDLIGWGDLIQD
jgi:hypothetical protein